MPFGLGSIFSNRCDNTVTTSAIAVMLTKKEIVALLKKSQLHCTMSPLSNMMLLWKKSSSCYYRRIICICSSRYYLEQPKIILQQLLEQNILHYQQKPEYAPGSCYRSTLSSCSYCRSIFCSKWRNLTITKTNISLGCLGNPSKTTQRILPVKGGGVPPLSAKLF